MQALILAGGKGTRLRPLTVYTPKPIVPVINRPFLLYQIEVLRRAGITDITLSLSYQPDKIQQILGNGSEHGVTLRYITEPSPLGTAGAYRFAMDGMNETTVVFNGDILTDIDIAKLIEFHNAKAAQATIALVRVDDPARYGLAEAGSDGRVVKFIEKPKAGEADAFEINTINAGIYILEPTIMDLIQKTPTPRSNTTFSRRSSKRKFPFSRLLWTKNTGVTSAHPPIISMLITIFCAARSQDLTWKEPTRRMSQRVPRSTKHHSSARAV
ncbi:MAG: nucleotidyltransferase family protein [Chloracidobacterium sp.]|nr:nucleotidyltransferase family protein [Chloracidobacterium sp.]